MHSEFKKKNQAQWHIFPLFDKQNPYFDKQNLTESFACV